MALGRRRHRVGLTLSSRAAQRRQGAMADRLHLDHVRLESACMTRTVHIHRQASTCILKCDQYTIFSAGIVSVHNMCHRAGSASRRRRQEPEIDHFTIKSRDCPIGQERSPPRSKRLAEKRIFAQLKFRSISITEREKTWQRPPGCSGSKLVVRL